MYWSVFKYTALTAGAIVLFFKKLQYKDGKLTVEVDDMHGVAEKCCSAVGVSFSLCLF